MIRVMGSVIFYIFTSFFWGLLSSKTAYAHEVSLRDKIGQMFIVGFDGQQVDAHSAIVQDIEQCHLGGVILFDYNQKTQTFNKNISSVEQVQRLNQSLQKFNSKALRERGYPDLPLLIAVDYEGGMVTRLKEEYGFPMTLSAEKIGQLPLEEARLHAIKMAETLKSSGFNLNFAPVLDVNKNPENPILGIKGRTYSDSPVAVSTYASLFSSAYRDQSIQCVFKHFPGHGSSTSDSHLGFVDVTSTWRADELEPYVNLIAQSHACGAIMSAHVVNRQLDPSGLPATLSYPILTGLLRNTLHFEGVIVSDDMQMKAISEYYGTEEALVLAINAGVDLFIWGNQLGEPVRVKNLINLVESKVKSGEISEERINEAYERIVHLKQSLQLN